MSTRHFRRAALLACGLLILALPALADYERTFTFDGDELEVVDMIGAVAVTRAPGDEFTVKVIVRGEDATEDMLEFKVQEGRDASLAVVFPTKKHDDYVYPPLGRGSKTRIHFHQGRQILAGHEEAVPEHHNVKGEVDLGGIGAAAQEAGDLAQKSGLRNLSCAAIL